MLRRLIEVALPLKEVSEQSAREKSIRHGHISTLHIWWARRPLAACRAVLFATLIPDPDDPACPENFRQLVRCELGSGQFKPTNSEGQTVEDTPRNRCLEFIKHLVKWENSNDPTYIEPARRLIRAAHKILHPDSKEEMPKVLDPFAGGGAIPLEALRLGCEAHAIDINPVAHLIQLCTLVYPQRFGRPLRANAPVPDYIKEAAKNSGKEDGLFGSSSATAEHEYRHNPLAVEVKYWGKWVLENARRELAEFYPSDPDGSVPVAYLWARTVTCPNPACGTTIPLVRQLWLCNKPARKTALRMTPNKKTGRCEFSIVQGKDIDFDPSEGTMKQGNVLCPSCGTVMPGSALRSESKNGRMNEQLMAAVCVTDGVVGKQYAAVDEDDTKAYESAKRRLADLTAASEEPPVPTDTIPCNEPRRISPPLYGLERFDQLFNARQGLVAARLLHWIRAIPVDEAMKREAISAYLMCCLSKVIDRNANICMWQNTGEKIGHVFGRQALPMVWDYVESNPFGPASGNWEDGVGWIIRVIDHCSPMSPGEVRQASADRLPIHDGDFDAVVTDPPYYDAVPYSDLSDFFYVWAKRVFAVHRPEVFRTPLTPKAQEIVEQRPHRSIKKRKDSEFYESRMAAAFAESNRVLEADGLACVMFAHKSTTAWETLISGLLRAGLSVTASWPIDTEMAGRMVAMGTASLASSVTLIARKRAISAGEGLWEDVRRELREVSGERLAFFWNQGIRGADFFISAIGPALSVFGRYDRVKRLTGEEVTVGQFLDEVRDLVTHYALGKIVKGGQLGHIDPESQFYVVWKWSYGEAPVPADEAFKLAQALGFSTDSMWDDTGVLEKDGQNVSAVEVAKRMRMKNLGEPKADATPASTIDVLHRLCAFREKGENAAMAEFLARSGHIRSESLWLVAQAVSEILPDGDREKQLLQGLLNQRDGLQDAAREAGQLF